MHFLPLDASHDIHNLCLMKTELLISPGEDSRAVVNVFHIPRFLLKAHHGYVSVIKWVFHNSSAVRGRNIDKPMGIVFVSDLTPSNCLH